MNFLENKAVAIALKELNSILVETDTVKNLLTGMKQKYKEDSASIESILHTINKIEDEQLKELHSWLHALKENKTIKTF